MPRPLEIAISVCALLVLAPIMLMIAVVLAATSSQPVFFHQLRIGESGRSFTITKFRSLDAVGRPTRFGAFLRQYSLDELPEFWMVLRGDMALVGPRPLIEAHQPERALTRSARQRMKPGITGWAQINGRNTLAFEDTYRLDLWYARNRSAWLDLYILVVTLPCVVGGRGACAMKHGARPNYARTRRPRRLAT